MMNSRCRNRRARRARRASATHASKEAFDGLKRFFSEEEIAYLTLTAALINSWNRIAIASRGQYDRAMLHHKVAEAKVAEPA
jgi:hypothetical protein